MLFRCGSRLIMMKEERLPRKEELMLLCRFGGPVWAVALIVIIGAVVSGVWSSLLCRSGWSVFGPCLG
jgi:hypothetical protein